MTCQKLVIEFKSCFGRRNEKKHGGIEKQKLFHKVELDLYILIGTHRKLIDVKSVQSKVVNSLILKVEILTMLSKE